MTEDKVVRVPN